MSNCEDPIPTVTSAKRVLSENAAAEGASVLAVARERASGAVGLLPESRKTALPSEF